MNLPTRRGLTTVLAASVVVLLAACSAPAPSPGAVSSPIASRAPLASLEVPTAKSITGPSTATLASSAVDPVEANPTPTLPVSLDSHDPSGDVPVTVTSVKRVIAFDISGSIAGTVYGLGLGSHLVARDVATTVPAAKKLPLVTTTDGQSINAETVLSLKPDLIITDGTVGPTDVVQQLRESGIAVVYVKNEASFEGAAALAREVSVALGVPATGDKLAARITTEVDATEAQIASIAPSTAAKKLRIAFLYLRGGSGIYYLFGSGSGVDQLVAGLDGIDAAAEIDWAGMKPMTDEAIVAMNPDLILVMTDGLASVGGVDGLLKTKPAIALTTAGQNRRIVDMADGDILSFGPRSAEVLDALARAVYAPGD